jgi:hypothetical protein
LRTSQLEEEDDDEEEDEEDVPLYSRVKKLKSESDSEDYKPDKVRTVSSLGKQNEYYICNSVCVCRTYFMASNNICESSL